jgi:hypothetical protein
MSPIDERLKSLNIVLPDVMPPVVDGYVPAFAPFIRSGDQIHLSGRLGARRMVSPFVGRWARRLAWSKARSPHEGWQLSCWLAQSRCGRS